MGVSWKRGGYLGAVVGALIALTLTAGHAQDSTFLYRIDPGESLKIDRHSECRIVSNNGTSPVMVSTGTPAEWVIGTYAFLRNLGPMRGVTVNVCPGPGDPVVRKWALKAEDIYFTEFIEPCTAADRTTYLIGTTCDVASWNCRFQKTAALNIRSRLHYSDGGGWIHQAMTIGSRPSAGSTLTDTNRCRPDR